ncbi:hypothetical protein [Streptomyces sp. NRRL F-5135]|uniref:hypothetical protein n=1 Tax=Streptomyces sp. NRRL F-5135 TaxID=1463858 RepID=UPI0004C7295D|nr:hypothetical protein [Streptomyces sp. NRRL F-5135]
MTTYVMTVPGTLQRPLTEEARAAVLRALRPADPRTTDVGAAEELDILSVDSDASTFTLHLEVEAGTSGAAREEARRIAGGALEQAGLTASDAPLGEPVITAIDAE